MPLTVSLPERRRPAETVTLRHRRGAARGHRARRRSRKLKPAFAADGIVTAGNASQMSDGAAAAVVMSAERAQELGVKPLARFVTYAVAGVPPEIMGIGPVEAIPKALQAGRPEAADIDLIELNEAFACQALAVIEARGPRPGEGERERRRGRARPPAGLHRREADRADPGRAASGARPATGW